MSLFGRLWLSRMIIKIYEIFSVWNTILKHHRRDEFNNRLPKSDDLCIGCMLHWDGYAIDISSTRRQKVPRNHLEDCKGEIFVVISFKLLM